MSEMKEQLQFAGHFALMQSQIAGFMGPTWGPPGSCRPQMGPILAPWTLLLGMGYKAALVSFFFPDAAAGKYCYDICDFSVK